MSSVSIGEIVGGGYQTWKRNLVLCVPFIIGVLLSVVVAVLIIFPTMFAVFLPFIQQTMTNPTAAQSQEIGQEMLKTFVEHLWLFIGVILIVAIIDGFIMSFFTSGAIGMAKEAILNGQTNLQHMMSYGKRKFISYFGAGVLLGLVMLLGILFLIPGLMNIFAHADLITSQPTTSSQIMEIFLPLIFGFIIMAIYVIPMSIILLLVPYAVVLDDLGPFEGFKKGIHAVWQNKANTFLLWLIIFIGGIIISLLGAIPYIGWIVTLILMYTIFMPMITIWLSKFYLTATKTNESISTNPLRNE
jgi:hypothetical protein